MDENSKKTALRETLQSLLMVFFDTSNTSHSLSIDTVL